MTEAVLVINAGSSSIKFAAYGAAEAEEPALIGKGQIEGIGSQPRFVVKDPDGGVLDEHRWTDGALAHGEAFGFIISWIERNASNVHLAAAGHRVVHGGLSYTQAVRIDDTVRGESGPSPGRLLRYGVPLYPVAAGNHVRAAPRDEGPGHPPLRLPRALV
jgi:acetate kinase